MGYFEFNAGDKLEAKQVLLRTRMELSNPDNWAGHKATKTRDDGKQVYCLALTASFVSEHSTGAMVCIARMIPGLALNKYITSGSLNCAIGNFNDNPNTTHADIMAILDAAIASVS